MLKLLRTIFRWLIDSKGVQKDRAIYEALKQETELAPKSKKCAVRSIVFSLLTYVIIGVTFAIVYCMWKYNYMNVIGNIIITVVLCIGMLYLLIACYIRSIINLIHQFRLNKKAHTWIAFVMAILPTLLFVLAVLLVVGLNNGQA